MASQIEIINLALTKLGQRHIASLAENNEAARFYQANYENLLLSELRSHVWGFAKARIALPALGTTPAFVYTYEYALPEGYVRALQVGDFQPGVTDQLFRTFESALHQARLGRIVRPTIRDRLCLQAGA
jgi:hypothetical protein